MADFFPIQFTDLSFNGRLSSEDPNDPLGLPVSQCTLRRWLARGLLSGYAVMSGGIWGFTSDIVEQAKKVHKQQGRREPPHPVLQSGQISVAEFRERLDVGSSQAYKIISKHTQELGVKKVDGRINIPAITTAVWNDGKLIITVRG